MRKLLGVFLIVCFVQFLNTAWAADGDPVLEGKTATGNITTGATLQGEHVVSTDDADIADNLTVGDVVIDEAAGVLNFTGATSATISAPTAALLTLLESVTIGDNSDNDFSITFDGDTSDGILNYDEDNADFEFNQDVASTGNVEGATLTYNGAEVYRVGGTDVSVPDGGTGKSSWTQYAIPYAPTTTTIGEITPAASSVMVTDGSNVPSLATDIPTAVTIGAKYIYRADGTDVAIADGGTGASTATAAFDALSPMTTVGDLIYGGASGTGTRLPAGATTEILVGGGAAAPVWTTATGTGAPVRATSPTLTTPNIGVASGTDLTLSGKLVMTPEDVSSSSDGVALSAVISISNVTTNGDGDEDSVTLANGTEGQVKIVVIEAEGAGGDSLGITPATFANGTKVVIDDVGESATFIYNTTIGWILISSVGGVVS